MEDNQQAIDNVSCRFNRGLFANTNVFGKLYDATRDRIPEAIVSYICWEHQFDIFGYGIIDPCQFGKQLDFTLNYLREPVSLPCQLESLKGVHVETKTSSFRKRGSEEVQGDDIICDKRLTNALYVLSHIPVTMEGITVTEETIQRNTETFLILDGFSVIQDRKTGKVFYKYHLSERFRLSLNQFYIYLNISTLIALRPRGLGAVYGFLVHLSRAVFSEGHTSTTAERTPPFDFWCDWAGIHDTNPAQKKKKLYQAFDFINTHSSDLKFSVEWVSKGGRYKYTPIIHFVPRPGDIKSDDDISGMAKRRRLDERVDVILIELKHQLYDACPKENGLLIVDAEKHFYSWLEALSVADRENIRRVMANTFVNTNCKIPKDIDKRVSVFLDKAANNGHRNFDEWLREIIHSPNTTGFRININS